MMAARPPAVRAAASVRPAATAPSPTAKSLPLAPAGTASNFAWSGKKTATLYRVTAPADPVLVHGNRLCGAKGPQPVPLHRRLESDLVGSDFDPLHGVFGERAANPG